MNIPINKIKPDPDQPRRTFNEEKMQALEASIRADGFRTQYPIIVNGGNIIVDGERRWRAAKAVGIKEVPVEVKHDVSPAQRLLYQLQSEGAELDFIERNRAWAKLWELSKNFSTKRDISKKLGIPEDGFAKVIKDYAVYQEAISKITNKASAAEVSYDTLVELGNEDKEIISKAVKEKWGRDKTREIKQAIKERPLRQKQILSQDYSDPFEGSSQWKTRLEVAKSDIDIEVLREMGVGRDKMFHQVDKWDQLMRSIVSLRVAVDEFDYKLAPPEIRIKLHKSIVEVAPFLANYLTDLENYMKVRGELTGSSIKQIK